MDRSRVSFGEMVAAASGLALFLSLFLPWYERSAPSLPQVAGLNLNAWQAFDLIDLALLLVAAAAVAVAVLRAADAMPELPAPPATIVMGAGLLAVVLIVFRVLVPPEDEMAQLIVELEMTREIGIFLGLAAAAGIAYGGYRQAQEQGGAPSTPRSGTAGPADESAGADVPAAHPGRPAPPSGPAQPPPPAPPGSSS